MHVMKTSARLLFCVCLLAGTGSYAAPNVLVNGDFSDESKATPVRLTGSGKFSVQVEDLTWNRHGRLALGKLEPDGKDGFNANAGVVFGGDGGADGFPVTGGELYDLAIDLKGTSPEVFMSVRAWREGQSEKDAVSVKTSLGKIAGLGKEWTRYRATFRPPQGVVRGKIILYMWWTSAWGKTPPYKQGDTVDFDNVTVSLRKGGLDEFAAKHPLPFSLAPVPVTEDNQMPYLPESVMNPPSEVKLRAARNSVKSLPLALANLTERTEEYRVTIETTDFPGRTTQLDGRIGLNGFPQSGVTMRRGVVVKDSDPSSFAAFKRNGIKAGPEVTGRIIDPMPLMDESFTVTVPSKEARLIWIDFDTKGVPSGKYDGIVRVIPQSAPFAVKSQRGKGFKELTLEGPELDLPVSLEVLPFELPDGPTRPAGFYGAANSENMFREMLKLGAREFQISSWAFSFALDDKGDIVPSRYRPGDWEGGNAKDMIRAYRKWADAAGVKINYFIGYSCYMTFKKLYGLKDDSPGTLRLWKQWVAAVKWLMNEAGVPDSDYMLELWDEPNRLKIYDLTVETCRLAREAAGPEARLLVTINYNPWEPRDLEALKPNISDWIFYDGKFLYDGSWKKYGPFIRGLIERGDFVSHYTCSILIREDLDSYYRRNAWMGELRGLSGNNLYDIMAARGGLGAKDWKCVKAGGILYRSFDRTIPSLRALALREGMEDIRYLDCLRRLRGNDPSVRAFLAEAPVKMVANPPGGDRKLADRLREKAIDLILEGLGKPASAEK